MIDVSELITDPDFAKTFTVRRRVQSVNDYGEVSHTETDFDVVGCIQAGSVSPLTRDPDYEMTHDDITVYSPVALIGLKQSNAPDHILYRGNTYVVKKIYDWFDYGNGWCAAIAEMINVVKS